MEIIPFYAVCDESSSMQGEPVETINTALADLYKELRVIPTVTDKVRFSLIGFSTDPEVLLELSDLSEVSDMPGLEAEGWTYFGKVFRLLRQTIEQDITGLMAENHTVFRPVVFFLSDGAPTDADEWPTAHAELVSPAFKGRPHIVAFGIGQSDPAVIRKVATFKAFIQSDDNVSPAEALREFAIALTHSIINSVTGGSGSTPTLQVQDEVPGYTSLELDAIKP
jgi:uncharacterized protein YegL